MKCFFIALCSIQLWQLRSGFPQSDVMSKKTVLNEPYRGLVEAMSIPAEVQERDGKLFASFAGAVPIHSCTKEQIANLSKTSHHYCDIFTDQTLAPLGELAYVRLDENTAEKVFINRNKRILLISSDGKLAQWRCAPTFESSNLYIAGTPILSASGELLSLVTAKRGNHYAVSNTDGIGGYFDTIEPWRTITTPDGELIYGVHTFPTRDALREFVDSLPPGAASSSEDPINFVPAVQVSSTPRITLVAGSGRQIAHNILQGVIVNEVEYL